MSQPVSEIRRPRTDDRPLWNIIFALWGYPAMLVSHDLKLFDLLAERPRTTQEVCDELKIARRPAEALLMMNTTLGLLQVEDGRYRPTALAEDYLLESSPTSFCGYLDFVVKNYPIWSVESLKKAVLTNSAQVQGDFFKLLEEHDELARMFTRAMHAHGMAAALEWPEMIDLSQHRRMLDIGGGSGAQSVGAALRWPHLQAIVFDLPPVCRVAEEYVARFPVQGRVRTQAGDMWVDPFPPADLHFYGDVFHDWPPEKGQFLARKGFESLESGGRIILREALCNDEKTGPLSAAAYNINMLLLTGGEGGRQFSGSELTTMLTEAGFVDIEVKPTSFGYRSIVTGRKP